MRNKIFSFLMCFALVLSFSAGASASKETNNPLATPDSYSQYLENYDETEAIRLGVDPEYVKEAVQDAKDTLQKYKSFSYDQQRKVIELMQSPSQVQKSFTDAKIVRQEISSESLVKPQANTRSVSHEYTMNLLGIDWTIFVVNGKYEYNSKEVTKELGASGYVKRNLNPLIQTSKSDAYDDSENGKYTGTAVFDYKLGPLEGFSLQVGSTYCRVYADKNGKTGGRGWSE
ncbi:hypothetical protein [Brevibacillus laterosporus]|uniref:hypothetical protein n=1 Tax=Brevibacillus laterosporus TaxID=1465 RepID=UPI000E6C1BBA|nr:hypothetical protein [Brevibacillus laterosporus]AYB37684.1 hypothetical protein D5F52_04960 [Brevibacillus laterosporus]MBM7108290.1 hypothetical protein [Brevibacillus laterosporus]